MTFECDPAVLVQIALGVFLGTVVLRFLAGDWGSTILTMVFLAVGTFPLFMLWGDLGFTLEVYSDTAFYLYLVYVILYSITIFDAQFWILGTTFRLVIAWLFLGMMEEYSFMFGPYIAEVSQILFATILIGIGKGLLVWVYECVPWPLPGWGDD